MAQSAEDKAKAAAIVGGWTWQIAEGHNYRYRHATRTLTRFYEAASMQPDEVKLVVEYLRDQEIAKGEGVSILNRPIDFGEGWKAKDAWYQTVAGERFANTDSTKVRVYQILFQAPEDAEADGPYAVENGCAYKSTNEFYWDVESLPGLPASSSGVEYSMRGVTRDRETGLFSCVVEKRERVRQDVAEYFTQKTVFENRKEEQHLGVRADDLATAGKAASVSGGVIVSRKVTKNADCTSDVTNATVTEVGVEGAAVKTSVSLEGTVTTTVNRNQAAPASADGLDVGESVENAKTEGGLWNQTVTKLVKSEEMTIAEGCRKTAFEHAHVETTVQGTDPGFAHAAAASGGVVSEKSVRRTATGAYQVEARETTEVGVEGAVVETRKTVSGTTTTTLDRNQAAAKATTGLKVGESVRVEKTPGGLYNNQKTTTEPSNATLQTACEQSGGVSHTDVTVKNEGSAATGCAKASANVVTRKSSRLNENGTYDNETRTTTYSTVTATATTNWATETATRTTKANDTDLSPSATKGEASASPNDHGTATTSVTEYTPHDVDSGWITWESTAKTANGEYKYKHGLRIFCNLSAPPTPPSGSNCSLNCHINKFGLFDGSISYSDLVSWTQGSGGSGSGGSQGGTMSVDQFKHDALGRTWKRTVTVATRTYYGKGNEGAEASDAANEHLVEGLSLHGRTYAVGSPSYGSWSLES